MTVIKVQGSLSVYFTNPKLLERYRPAMWYLERSDPCDELPEIYALQLWHLTAMERGDYAKAQELAIKILSLRFKIQLDKFNNMLPVFLSQLPTRELGR